MCLYAWTPGVTALTRTTIPECRLQPVPTSYPPSISRIPESSTYTTNIQPTRATVCQFVPTDQLNPRFRTRFDVIRIGILMPCADPSRLPPQCNPIPVTPATPTCNLRPYLALEANPLLAMSFRHKEGITLLGLDSVQGFTSGYCRCPPTQRHRMCGDCVNVWSLA